MYAWVFQFLSFPQVSPLKPCMHLSWLDYGLEIWGIDSRRGQEIYFSSQASNPELKPSPPLIKWTLSMGEVAEAWKKPVTSSCVQSLRRNGAIPPHPQGQMLLSIYLKCYTNCSYCSACNKNYIWWLFYQSLRRYALFKCALKLYTETRIILCYGYHK